MTLTESRAARAAREAPAGGPEKVTRRKRQEVTFDLVSPCSIHTFIHWCIFTNSLICNLSGYDECFVELA